MSDSHHHRFSQSVGVHPDEVWQVVSDHATMVRWLPFALSLLEVSGQDHPRGAGAVRSLTSPRGSLVERVTAYDDAQRSLDYELVGGLPLSHYTARVSVAPLRTGCVLSTEMTVASPIPGVGAVVGWLMTRLTTRGAAHFAETQAHRNVGLDDVDCSTAVSKLRPRPARWLHRLAPATAASYVLGGAAIGALLTVERIRTAIGPRRPRFGDRTDFDPQSPVGLSIDVAA